MKIFEVLIFVLDFTTRVLELTFIMWPSWPTMF